MIDKLLYERAASDFTESRDEALWLKAIVECSGDEGKAKFLYIKLRAEELAADSNEKSTQKQETPIIEPVTTTTEQPETLVKFAKQISLSIAGTLADSIQEALCQTVRAKKFDEVLCDLYANRDVILVAPAAKDRSGLALAGIVLSGGAGAIGALGMAAGAAVGQALRNRQANETNALIQNLSNTIIIDARSVKLQAYDYRRVWDLAGGEWETRVSIEGKAIFNGTEGDIKIIFSFEGKTYERTLFSKANNKVPELARLIDTATPDIPKETKIKW